MSGVRQPPRYWFDGSAPPWHARIVSRVYAAVVGARAAAYRRGWLQCGHPGVPVVVVGNLIAGGSGKTPTTIAIVERLRAEGWAPGVASRGYGRRDAATPRWVDAATDPADGGDEPVLIARRTAVRVRVDRDRLAAARALVAEGCDIVVCDDGLQHYRLARDVEIEVIDGRRRYGNGHLLPAGPLREPPERATRCDFRVVNLGAEGETEAGHARSGEAATATQNAAALVADAASADANDRGLAVDRAAGFGEWPMRLAVGDAQALRGARHVPLSAFAGQRVHAVAGIGDPERFFRTLRAAQIAVVPHAFPDHHRYVAADLHFGSDLPVLMTEKDAVKCAAFAADGHYGVAVRAELPEAFWVALSDRIKSAHRQPNSRTQA
jgi:tetraacyldisaccharide 4'-kinase